MGEHRVIVEWDCDADAYVLRLDPHIRTRDDWWLWRDYGHVVDDETYAELVELAATASLLQDRLRALDQ